MSTLATGDVAGRGSGTATGAWSDLPGLILAADAVEGLDRAEIGRLGRYPGRREGGCREPDLVDQPAPAAGSRVARAGTEMQAAGGHERAGPHAPTGRDGSSRDAVDEQAGRLPRRQTPCSSCGRRAVRRRR